MTHAGRIDMPDESRDGIDKGRRLIRLDDGGLSLSERLATRFRHMLWRTPLHRLRLRGKFPLKLLAVPGDPIPGDRTRGTALLEGRALYHGQETRLADLDFATLNVSPGLADYLQSFEWLRDLASAGPREETAPIAEKLMRNWLETHGGKVAEAGWRTEMWGHRIFLWASYAPLILSSADLVYRSAVLNTLARGARHLDRAAPKEPPGLTQVRAWAGVIGAGLLVQGGESRVARGEVGLERSLSQTLTADGGIICRSPVAQLALVETLAMLRSAYDSRGIAFPAAFSSALSFAVPALLGVTLGDGGLSSWQGGPPVPGRRIAAAIEASGQRGLPLRKARDWGYHRMTAGDTVLVVDAAPPPSMRLETGGCASTLAFELSHGPHRIVVNCGGAGGSALPGNFAQGLRTTAAHSTLTIGDSNSTALNADGSLGRGVVEVELNRRERNGIARLEASHDGYVPRFGFVHRRQLGLSEDGDELRGEDVLLPGGRHKSEGAAFAIRFHLGAGVEVSPTADNMGALLRVEGGPAWHFRCRGTGLMIDDSVWIDEKSRLCKTKQLVLAGESSPGGTTIGWLFRRAG
ncbi:putative heparinase superfamily protein [Parasphingopyxis lamellibrachiae]|uniref:Putative heparinase superfamily protein n=2 Tax=Parasphingopyxis lamellibrachiae TaxID=680125 RepID=A0A3D9FGY0_9SPHN|nr:putative heparinase superfamily protein [Parasphingopyxis lamellibrachiae]